jgi:hypothetical protein
LKKGLPTEAFYELLKDLENRDAKLLSYNPEEQLFNLGLIQPNHSHRVILSPLAHQLMAEASKLE